MKDHGGGNILNVGSISSLIVNRPQWQPSYNASKAAVHQLTKSLAAEWAPYGIRVNAIAPGYVKTEMAPVDKPEFRQHWIEDAPMKRYALPEEIAPDGGLHGLRRLGVHDGFGRRHRRRLHRLLTHGRLPRFRGGRQPNSRNFRHSELTAKAQQVGSRRRGETEDTVVGHARYIGRVGALAVTLGVGVAMATTPGLAYAEPTSDSSTSSESSPSASTGAPSTREPPVRVPRRGPRSRRRSPRAPSHWDAR